MFSYGHNKTVGQEVPGLQGYLREHSHWPSGLGPRFASLVMGLIPTQWTGMLYQCIVSWLKIASCPQGLVDTIGRWKNSPRFSN